MILQLIEAPQAPERRSDGNNIPTHNPATAKLTTPPATIAETRPSHAAVSPDSNSPNSFDAPTTRVRRAHPPAYGVRRLPLHQQVADVDATLSPTPIRPKAANATHAVCGAKQHGGGSENRAAAPPNDTANRSSEMAPSTNFRRHTNRSPSSMLFHVPALRPDGARPVLTNSIETSAAPKNSRLGPTMVAAWNADDQHAAADQYATRHNVTIQRRSKGSATCPAYSAESRCRKTAKPRRTPAALKWSTASGQDDATWTFKASDRSRPDANPADDPRASGSAGRPA